jgi:hypothetical protein
MSTALIHPAHLSDSRRYGCRLVSFGETSMYDFFVAFMGVFFSGQATSQLFQFSTSEYTPELTFRALS